MKKALILLSVLALLLLTACSRAASAETPAPAETPIPEAAPLPPETEELSLTVTQADAYGCVFTLENRCTEENRSFDYVTEEQYALQRRTAAGGWEWVQPIRRNLEPCSATLERGLSRTDAWDWSYACGPLPAGEYRLVIWGQLGMGLAGADSVSVGGTFTLEDSAPEGPGPLFFRNSPGWLNGSLYGRDLKSSGHRWMQTFTPEREGWATETEFFLYRKTKEGELIYIPPEYRLPAYLNRTVMLNAGETVSFGVELAARYGQLERGTYVLRRRVVFLTEEERAAGGLPDGSFRLLPEERFVYADAEFSLYNLRDVPQAADPIDELRDYGSLSTTVLVSSVGSSFSSTGCTLRLKNADANQWYDVSYESDYYYLYFNHKLEWYPAAHSRYGAHGLIWKTLAPGETGEVDIDFTFNYGELPPAPTAW